MAAGQLSEEIEERSLPAPAAQERPGAGETRSRQLGARPTIAGVLKHYLRDHGWWIKAPRCLRELAARLPQLRAEMEHRLGRPPAVVEMAQRAAVTEERMAEAMEFRLFAQPVSLAAPL